MALPEIAANLQAFVEEYCKDRNGVRAALAAGLAATYGAAGEQASQLLKKPEIIAWVRHVFLIQARRLKTEVPDIVREWAIMGKSDITDYVVDDKGRLSTAPGVPRSALRAVKKVKQTRTVRVAGKGDELVEETRTEIELHDKVTPLTSIYNHLHGALPGEDKASATVELLARLAALAGARQLEPGGAGAGAGGAAVGTEPGAAEPGVPVGR
jgi:phage terminase small subunit